MIQNLPPKQKLSFCIKIFFNLSPKTSKTDFLGVNRRKTFLSSRLTNTRHLSTIQSNLFFNIFLGPFPMKWSFSFLLIPFSQGPLWKFHSTETGKYFETWEKYVIVNVATITILVFSLVIDGKFWPKN